MPNRLAESSSPYLLQHADNPVDWWEWGPEAFAEARRRDVPVLLCVGYAACHWCHVMAHESFEDAATAALMNEHFVNVKVDREERPDVDAVYMEDVQAMTGQGGWPMTVFLTPDGEPFYAGTYFPPTPRHGMPSFSQLLRRSLARPGRSAATRRRRPRPHRPGAGRRAVPSRARPVDAADARRARRPAVTRPGRELRPAQRRLRRRAQVPAVDGARVAAAPPRAHRGRRVPWRWPSETFEAMARGGMYDQLGGGFARYSVDADWVVPHFEKMLYDNALLLRAYLHWWRATGSPLARRVVEETAEFLLRDLRTPEGGFASALDADTEGVEGTHLRLDARAAGRTCWGRTTARGRPRCSR